MRSRTQCAHVNEREPMRQFLDRELTLDDSPSETALSIPDGSELALRTRMALGQSELTHTSSQFVVSLPAEQQCMFRT